MPDAGSGLFPGSPGQWTVVAILMEVGTGEGETPSPRKANPATPPPRPPIRRSSLAPRAGAVRGDGHGKNLPEIKTVFRE